MSDPRTLQIPTLYEAVLDAAQIQSWLGDIENCAEDLDVRVRGAAGCSVARACAADLREWLDRVVETGSGALQVRYRFQSREWCDTLLPHELGCRLVRLEEFRSRRGPSSERATDL